MRPLQLTCPDALPYSAWVQLNSPDPCTHQQGTMRLTPPLHPHPMSLRNTTKSIEETRSIYVSKGRNILCGFVLVDSFLFAFSPPILGGPAAGDLEPWAPAGSRCCQAQGQGPWISHKTLPARPTEFIVTGTLLQSTDCSDTWELSNENLPH